MKSFITYCFLVFTVASGISQPVGWGTIITAKTKKVVFSSRNFIKIDGATRTVVNNDYVGIFTAVNSKETCVGYTKITFDTSTTFQLTIYGKSSSQDTAGYTENATYRIRWWSSLKNCQYILTNSDTVAKLDSAKSQLNISSAIGFTPKVNYANRNFTIGDKDPSPSISQPIPDLSFSSSSGLTINSTTGTIDLANSSSGIYRVQLASIFCISPDTFKITILENKSTPLDLSKLSYSLLNPGCKSLGSIFFKTDNIIGKKPFTLKLTNVSSKEEYENKSGQFDDLREGIYELMVTDSVGISSNYMNNISLFKTEECANSILAPNARDGLQAIFIPEVGTAKILDRLGNTVKQISIPAEWDARDSNGQFVPMGDYYLFINDQQSKIITVIR